MRGKAWALNPRWRKSSTQRLASRSGRVTRTAGEHEETGAAVKSVGAPGAQLVGHLQPQGRGLIQVGDGRMDLHLHEGRLAVRITPGSAQVQRVSSGEPGVRSERHRAAAANRAAYGAFGSDREPSRLVGKCGK